MNEIEEKIITGFLIGVGFIVVVAGTGLLFALSHSSKDLPGVYLNMPVQ